MQLLNFIIEALNRIFHLLKLRLILFNIAK